MGRDSTHSIGIITHQKEILEDPILEASEIASTLRKNINPDDLNADLGNENNDRAGTDSDDNDNQLGHESTKGSELIRSPKGEGEENGHLFRQLSIKFLTKAQKLASATANGIYRNRMRNVERIFASGNSTLDIDIPGSKRMQDFADHEKTADDLAILNLSESKTFDDILNCSKESRRQFFLTRVTDPTSYFYRYRFDSGAVRKPLHAHVDLVDISWLKAHEQIVSWDRVSRLKHAIVKWGAYTEALLVDRRTGAILDGHHRYRVGIELKLARLPVVLVDYLEDDSITVDVWPECGRDYLTKNDVIEMALSDNLFPPKTSRHKFSDNLPPIFISLKELEQKDGERSTTIASGTQQVRRSNFHDLSPSVRRAPRRKDSLPELSLRMIFSLRDIGFSALRSIFRSRIRESSRLLESGKSILDVCDHRTPKGHEKFQLIRAHDPTSSFCRQSSQTFEDLISASPECRRKFLMSRVMDPTSYFYKYRFDCERPRQPKRVKVELVDIAWLKPHEQVVSWDRVSGLRRATLNWDAYTEPLLVDSKTGAILDGHHRHQVGLQLGLARLPAVLVDYLGDELITVDVWPDCGLDSITKQDVIKMSLSDSLFPPKTSRHTFSDDLPPISISLNLLRQS